MRVDKLTLAALEATLTGPASPVFAALATDPDELLARARGIAPAIGPGDVAAERSRAGVGGGGAPGVVLPSAAVVLPAHLAEPLRRGGPGDRPRSRGSAVARPDDGADGADDSWRRAYAACWIRRPDVHVVATAGHVDHGKSTLVRALTGQDPDRLEEEHRRGLSIELGYCWTHLAGAGDVAFVDVPGHERFLATTLAGAARSRP